MSTISSLSTHFCAEFKDKRLSPHDIEKLFLDKTFMDVLSASSSSEDLAVALSKSRNAWPASCVDGMIDVLKKSPNAYIKLRSMSLTQQLLSAMPDGVRESINRMASQLLSTTLAPAVVPESVPETDDEPVHAHEEQVNVQPVQNSSSNQLISGLMSSGIFQEMSDMMKSDADNQSNVADEIQLLSEKLTLLSDRLERVERLVSSGRRRRQ
jgi:hypothetical protein